MGSPPSSSARRALLDAGGEVDQETLHFDPRSGALTPLRSKEYAHDYRYFPEPDLVPLAPTEEMLNEAREALPELPAERRQRYVSELGLSPKPANQLAFDAELADYFEQAVAAATSADPGAIANWVTGDLTAALREAGADAADPAASKVSPGAIAGLADLAAQRKISSTAARQVLGTLVAEGGDPARGRRARGAGPDGGLGRARVRGRPRARSRARGRRQGP